MALIDTENTSWAVYQKSTKSILSRRKKWPVANGGPIIDLDSDYVWLLEFRTPKPSYNDNTQYLKKVEKVNLTGKKLETNWEVIDLTQEEIDAKLGSFFETSGGIKLDVSIDAQNAFTRMNSMIQLTGMANSENVQIKDIAGDLHTLTVTQLKTILKEYGTHCYNLFLS